MSVLITALLLGVHPFERAQTASERYRIPAWEIRVTRDRFTGASRCLLYQGHRARQDVSYAHGAVSFQFSPRLNTTDASLKLDGNPLTDAASDDAGQASAAGISVNLGNVTGGASHTVKFSVTIN